MPHKTCLRVTYKDRKATFEEDLEMNNIVFIIKI